MALTRKKRNVLNPFVVSEVNTLAEVELYPSWLEDILVGCIRSVRADNPHKGRTKYEAVSLSKVVKVYKRLDKINFTDIQRAVVCSATTAKLINRVIKLANLFIARYIKTGKVDMTPEPIESWRDPCSDFALGNL